MTIINMALVHRVESLLWPEQRCSKQSHFVTSRYWEHCRGDPNNPVYWTPAHYHCWDVPTAPHTSVITPDTLLAHCFYLLSHWFIPNWLVRHWSMGTAIFWHLLSYCQIHVVWGGFGQDPGEYGHRIRVCRFRSRCMKEWTLENGN